MTIPKTDDFIANGATTEDVVNLPKTPVWPQMAPEAYHGLASRIVKAIEPYSEADPVAILGHVLVATGNMLGRGPHALVEKTEHTCGEFVCLVGDTAKGRKGQAWSTPKWMLGQADETWARTRIRSGLSSGEGLIANVRDERWGTDKKGDPVLEDQGESDKRLLVIEPELATVLRRMQSETNSLSAVLREAWETGNLGTLTKNSPLRATGAHISVIAHTTREDLVTSLTETDRANGFANRFIFLLAKRSKCLPDPTAIPDAVLLPLIEDLRTVIQQRDPRVLIRDEQARALWAKIYPKLSEGEPGLLGAVLARAEAHALRLSVLYAVFDRSPQVREEHLRTALAVWDYADASTRRIFGDALGLSVADTILAALRKRGPLSRTEISALFGRNKTEAEIAVVLTVLLAKGLVQRTIRQPESGKGRPHRHTPRTSPETSASHSPSSSWTVDRLRRSSRIWPAPRPLSSPRSTSSAAGPGCTVSRCVSRHTHRPRPARPRRPPGVGADDRTLGADERRP
jgi:predicted transcriptional regulator